MQLKRDAVTTDEMIDWMQQNAPTGDTDLDEAWRRVREETPYQDPRDCPMIRGLVRAKRDVISSLRQTT